MCKEESCGCGCGTEEKNVNNSCGCGIEQESSSSCGCSVEQEASQGCGCVTGHAHGDSCGCGHEHEPMEVPVMKLMFDDGEEVNCMVLDLFEFEGKKYIILLPEGTEEYLVYMYVETEDGAFSLANIDNDEEFNRVIDFINEEIAE